MSIKIDKSLFSPEELKAYEALIAKASVEYDGSGLGEGMVGTPVEKNETKKEAPATPPATSPAQVTEAEAPTKKEAPATMDAKKSATPPELTAALSRLEILEKSIEMKNFTEIAKKYAPLGENEEELAKTLYGLKKSNETGYTAYISVLDKSLDLVNKSGLFAEIGKSASGYGASRGGVVEQIEKKAEEIMKSNNMDRSAAIAKAWEDNPDLAIAYEEEREGR